MIRNFVITCLLVLLSSCVFSDRTDVLRGQVYSPETLAFLNMKGATRNEVISTLGTPVWESKNSQVLLYVSETALHWTGVNLEPVLSPEGSDEPVDFKPVRINEDGKHKLHVLLIAYDEHGFIKSHVIRKIGNRSLKEQQLEDLCVQYSHATQSRNFKPSQSSNLRRLFVFRHVLICPPLLCPNGTI